MSTKAEAIRPLDEVSRVTELLLKEVLNPIVQDRLFPVQNDKLPIKEASMAQLRAEYPANIVIDADLLDKVRYMAALYGAGFRRAEFDDLTYSQTGEEGVEISVESFLNEIVVSRIPKTRFRHSQMWDSVLERMANELVPTIVYDLASGAYITTAEDLKKIFALDYENMQSLRDESAMLFY